MAIPFETAAFKAMILAAGRGERMRPLTDNTPKPLLQAGNHTLLEYQIKSLARAGFRDIVINHAHLGKMIENAIGCGDRYGVQVRYSPEKTALETAGGIANAMPLLTDDAHSLPFVVVNADIYCEFDYTVLLPVLRSMRQENPGTPVHLAHLILVDNPRHHTDGDFALIQNHVKLTGDNRLTFSGIGIYHPLLFQDVAPGLPVKLAPILREAINYDKVTGEYFAGVWMDVGTPDRLYQLHRQLSDQHG